MRTAFIFSAFFISLFFAAPAVAQISNDFDGDGTSDIVTASPAGTALRWQSTPTAGGSTPLDTIFGAVPDLPIPGYWKQAESPSVAVISTDDKKRHLLWQTLSDDGQLREMQLGAPGDYVLAGADLNGDGISDGAVMHFKGTKMRWIIQPGILSGAPAKKKSFSFGKSGQRVCFANPDGSYDWVGTFGLSANKKRSELALRNVLTGKVRRFKFFPKRLSLKTRPRPYPIQGENGIDNILFVTANKNTTVETFTIEGAPLFSAKFSGTVTFTIGDFDLTRPGEEVALQIGAITKYYNPLDQRVINGSAISGTAVGGLTITPTASLIPIPTATPTPSPTPAAQATATPKTS